MADRPIANQVWVTLNRDDGTLTAICDVPLGGKVTKAALPMLSRRIMQRAAPLDARVHNAKLETLAAWIFPSGQRVAALYNWEMKPGHTMRGGL